MQISKIDRTQHYRMMPKIPNIVGPCIVFRITYNFFSLMSTSYEI